MSKNRKVEIRRTIKNAVRLPFEKMARAILPERYKLSLVICGDTLAQKMNRRYRKKAYAPNVLSFPLERYEGEIFLNIRKAGREARAMRISAKARIAHLFVHGCLHLVGHRHGVKMNALEQHLLKKSGFSH